MTDPNSFPALARCLEYVLDVYRGNEIIDLFEQARAELRRMEELLAEGKKLVAWLEGLADMSDKAGAITRFASLAEANKADAKNYRATAKEMKRLVAACYHPGTPGTER